MLKYPQYDYVRYLDQVASLLPLPSDVAARKINITLLFEYWLKFLARFSLEIWWSTCDWIDWNWIGNFVKSEEISIQHFRFIIIFVEFEYEWFIDHEFGLCKFNVFFKKIILILYFFYFEGRSSRYFICQVIWMKYFELFFFC